METVSDFAAEFVRKARAGEKPTVAIARRHAEPFLAAVAEQGLVLAKDCIDQISDTELRQTIEAIFLSTAAGAVGGAAIGAIVDGEGGAKTGAKIGAAIGAAASCFACTIRAIERNGQLVVSAP